jgi:uncharacterized membrane protein required for colicin V production
MILGILDELYIISQFTLCSENLLSLNDVPKCKRISLETALEQSVGNGQNYFK